MAMAPQGYRSLCEGVCRALAQLSYLTNTFEKKKPSNLLVIPTVVTSVSKAHIAYFLSNKLINYLPLFSALYQEPKEIEQLGPNFKFKTNRAFGYLTWN